MSNAGSWRSFVRRSTATSSSVGVSSPPRSELSSPLRRGGDRGLFGLETLRFGILKRGARQATNGSPRTCTAHTPNPSSDLRATAIVISASTTSKGTKLLGTNSKASRKKAENGPFPGQLSSTRELNDRRGDPQRSSENCCGNPVDDGMA
jgi:hypothetical protein